MALDVVGWSLGVILGEGLCFGFYGACFEY